MAMEDAIEAWKAMDILRRLGWGMQSAMRTQVALYRSSGNLRALQIAVTLPQNRRNKMERWIADNGVALLDEYLAQLPFVTRPQLNTFVQSMCVRTQDLFDKYQSEELTPDQIATDIETNIANPAERFTRLAFPFSPEYRDLWGE